MKAIVRMSYGPPGVLQLKEVEKPVPKDNEVLIKVYAATVNRTDCGILRAKPFIIRIFTGLKKPNKQTTGTDFAGEIEAAGKDAASFNTGDKVFGFDDGGLCSHAEYLTISVDKPLAIMPDGISYEQAAASLEGAHYAYNYVKKMNIHNSTIVLVYGATGAIGSSAVQFIKYFGAYVTAVCNTKNIELVKSLGADKIIDYTKEDFTQDDQTYNYVLDAVGKSTFGKCKPLLKPGGVYMSSDLGPMAQNPLLALLAPIAGSKKVKFPIPFNIKESILFIKKIIEEGKFKAVIDRVYSLLDIVDAYKYVEMGQKTGNVIIRMDHNN